MHVCVSVSVYLITERHLFCSEQARFLKTSTPNVVESVWTGAVTPPHGEHQSRLRLSTHHDENLLLWLCSPFQQTHPIFFFFFFLSARVHSAPGAGAGGPGPVGALGGSNQIREELFRRDCGVLSFTTAHFPSFHHAAIQPTLPWLFPWGLRKNIGIFSKYHNCIQINGSICSNQLSAFINYFPAYAQVSKLSLHTAYIKWYFAYITGLLLCPVTHRWKKTNCFLRKEQYRRIILLNLTRSAGIRWEQEPPDITHIIQSNSNASELETGSALIQFPHSFNNPKPVVLFTLHQSQSLEGIFLLERLPQCDTWAM